jgi:hypothetical protein
VPQTGDTVEDEAQVAAILEQHIQPEGKVKLVAYSWPTVDPQNLVEGQLRAACELRGEHWQQETGLRPIRIVSLVECNGRFVLEPRTAIDAVWDGQVALSAYYVPTLSPGDRESIVLWWRALQHPDQDYSVFVHLLDAQGEIITQYDKLPLSDFYPMSAWPLERDQRDVYPLKVPEDADLNGTQLAVGLYDRRTSVRLPVVVDGVPAGDAVLIPVGAP